MKEHPIWFPSVDPVQLEELKRLANNIGLDHHRPYDVIAIILASWSHERLRRELRAALRHHGAPKGVLSATKPVAVPNDFQAVLHRPSKVSA